MKKYFNFHGFTIKVELESEEMANLLIKDFAYFQSQETGEVDLSIKAEITEEIDEKVPTGLATVKQNVRAMTFEKGNLRYNYFYGQAVSIINYRTNVIEVFAKTESYLHEIIYLAILSRETKYHDQNGLHKIHAFGVSKGDTALIGMMNMKGGKTTLFSYFLDEDGYELLSDDTPLINARGEVLPFPIRLGFELNSYTQEKLSKYKNKAYRFERVEYGPKDLINILEFKNKVSAPKKKTVLFQGIRVHRDGHPEVKEIKKLKMLKYLVKNMIVGVGLPMVIEYYLESSFKDKLINIKTILMRSFAALSLLRNSRCYEVYLTNEPQKNFLGVKGLLDSYE
ncbi:MAG: hypothetical protein CME64_15490 [Halobacteriovoraceae bacterium]|nr:hypothetical protein [Halobacteriovoraceae bacterium]|tara:strand:+ start:147631 stop:148647 length:1017 start_codon:yes stop_codon:yes gene_type:complete